RFVDTRSSDSAERTLETALTEPAFRDVEAMMFAAVTDHVFIDEGHTIDFTNKAFEALDNLGKDAASEVLPTLVLQTTQAQRSEEFSEWRHPHDLVRLTNETIARLDDIPAGTGGIDAGALAWEFLIDDPVAVTDALVRAYTSGATDEEV